MNADNEIYQTIKRVVEHEISPASVVNLTIDEDIDHDGDPILRIEVVYNGTPNTGKLLGLVRRLRIPLQELGETRFPLFTFVTADEVDGAAA